MLERVMGAHEALLNIFAWLSSICLLAVSLVTSVDVAVRWSTGRPLLGILELNEVGFVLITFAAMGLMLFRDRQMSVDIFTTGLVGRRRYIAKLLDCFFGILFFGILFYTSSTEFLRAFHGGYVRNGILQIPEAIPLSFVVVGSFLSLVTLLLQMIPRASDQPAPTQIHT